MLLFACVAGCATGAPSPQGGSNLFFEIIPIGNVGEDATTAASTVLMERFNLPVRLRKPIPLPEGAFDPKRKQYLADMLLESAYKNRTQTALRTIAICDVDIYVKGLNFVFGIGSEALSCCLVSATRLRDSFYRLRYDPKTFLARMRRLVLHEVGHTFGLKHCKNSCVMVFANSLMELDRTHDDYCPRCRHIIEAQLRHPK